MGGVSNPLKDILYTIKGFGLTLNLKKCSFAQNKTSFEGHVIRSGLIEPDPTKIESIDKIQPPTTKTEVRRLIGFFSYFRNFIPALAETARVITNLTQKSVPTKVPWNSKHQRALDKLKSDLSNDVQLHTIDYTREFGLSVDASGTAVGCCFGQTEGRNALSHLPVPS